MTAEIERFRFGKRDGRLKKSAGPVAKTHREIFLAYIQIDAAHLEATGLEGQDLEDHFEDLADLRDKLVDLSARLPAKSAEDVLFKMAVWRRHSEDVDPLDPDIRPVDKLSYSFFRDLAVLCDCETVLTERDKEYGLSLKQRSLTLGRDEAGYRRMRF